jgi:hypothetical protein
VHAIELKPTDIRGRAPAPIRKFARTSKQSCEGGRKRRRIRRRNKYAGFAAFQRFGNSTDGARHDRTSSLARFGNHEWKRIRAGRKYEYIGLLKVAPRILNKTDEMDPIGTFRRGRLSLEFLALWTLTNEIQRSPGEIF